MNQVLDVSAQILNDHMIEITAIASLVSIPFLMRMMAKDRKEEAAIGFISNQKVSWKKYFWIAGISVAMAIGLNNIILLTNLAQQSEAYQEVAAAIYSPPFLVQLLCVGVIVPIVEEIVFRGIIYRRKRVESSMVNAMIFSAVFFGVFHGNTVQMIYGLVAGLILAYIYEKYGSLWAPILAHILMNTTACVLTELDGFTWIFESPMRMGVITVACAAVGSSMFVLIRSIQEKPVIPVLKEEEQQEV